MDRRVVSVILVIYLCTWWLGSLHPRQTWHLSGNSNAVAISPDGRLLATSSGLSQWRELKNWSVSGSTNVELRRLSDGSVVHTLNAFYVTSLAFSPDNSLIAAGNYWGQIQIWRTKDGQLLHSFNAFTPIKPYDSEVQTLTFTPDGQTLVSGIGGQIDVWRVADGQHRYSLSNGNDYSISAMSPDGQLLALGGVRTPITLYRLNNGTIFRQLEIDGHPKFSADGQLLAISHSDSYENDYWRKVMLYRLQDDTFIGVLPGLEGHVIDLAFSPDGWYLAVAYKTGEGSGDFYEILPDLFSPMRSHLALWRLVRLPYGHYFFYPSQRLRSQKDSINSLAFSQDGKILASGSWDKTVRLWRRPLRRPSLFQVLLLGSLAGVLFYMRHYARWENLMR